MPMTDGPRTAAIIPCYRVRAQILDVLTGLAPHVDTIFVIDDACPEHTAALVREHAPDVHLIVHPTNLGVGAATVTGYRAALAAGFDLLLKLDGDGQMDPAHIPALLAPLRAGRADYAKGNRLATAADRRAMPPSRRLGNRTITLLARWMTGDPALSDPMNGYTAITAATLSRLPLDDLDPRFFFETDLLIHLTRLGARIAQLPMPSRYGQERSNLGPAHLLRHFPPKIAARLLSRLTTQKPRHPRA